MCGGEGVWLISVLSVNFTVNLEQLKKMSNKFNRKYYVPGSYHLHLQMEPGSRVHYPLNQHATPCPNSFLFKLIHCGKPTSDPQTKGSFLQIKARCRMDLIKGIAQGHTANSCHHSSS